MDDAHLAVALRVSNTDWSWASLVQIDAAQARLEAFAQVEGKQGWLQPLKLDDRPAIEGLIGTTFILQSRPESHARWRAEAAVSRGISAVPLGVELTVSSEVIFEREKRRPFYTRVVYRGIKLPGYTSYFWLRDRDGSSRRHGYTMLCLFGRDVIISDICSEGDESDNWFLGLTVSGEWFSELELDAIEMVLYLLAGGAGIRQCVESFDTDTRFVSRSFSRLGHAREREARLILPREKYTKAFYTNDVITLTENASKLINAGFPLRAILFRIFSSQQPVPEVAITELAIALDAMKNAVIVKVKGEGKLMVQDTFNERVSPVVELTKQIFSKPEDSVALPLILRRIRGANDWSDRQRWERFWRDHVAYQLTDREREVLEHRNSVVHDGYILQTEYDLALNPGARVDSRPYGDRLLDLQSDADIFRNVVNRVLLMLLGYRGEFVDFNNLQKRLDTRRIVCLGWGSLIWDSRNLRLRSMDKAWHSDGPELPIEFARLSSRDRISLVIVPGCRTTPVLWADLDFENIDEARANLAEREWHGSNPEDVVDFWHEGRAVNEEPLSTIAPWARARGIYGVIWTKLPAKFNGKDGLVPSSQEVLDFIANLSDKRTAQEYIRKAPAQIRTAFRDAIEQSFGWFYDGRATDPHLRDVGPSG